MPHEAHRLDSGVCEEPRRQAAGLVGDVLPAAAAVAGDAAKKPAGDRGAGAAVEPVVRAIWGDDEGTRFLITHITRDMILFQNLANGGHGQMIRHLFQTYFHPLP